jgi:hypothetical protein
MFNFIIGVAVGTAFAPFWMMVWNNYIKPVVDKALAKKQ